MNARFDRIAALLFRLRRDKSAATGMVVALTMVATVGSTALALDVGRALIIKRELQGASDAAALAGAAEIGKGTASATAAAYGSGSSGSNAIDQTTAGMASGYPQLKCLTSTEVSCGNSDNANAIVVRQEASLKLIFGPFIGFDTWSLSTTSTAGFAGGTALPIEVMIVMDTTASMNTTNKSCSQTGATRLTCALAGGRALLQSMSPSSQRVGLMTFPPATTAAQAARNYDCSSNTDPATAAYNATNPVYQVLGLGNDFRTQDSDTSLSTAANIVKAFKGGASGCQQGMSSPGGQGTFYADAIAAAQAALVSNGRSGVQRVIVLISDGDASASSTKMTSAKRNRQCQQAIDAAATAKAAGTWVYSIAYGAGRSGTCATDTGGLQACTTMQRIASDSSKFYVGNDDSKSTCASSANSTGDLVKVFGNIGKTFRNARLLPNNTI